MQDAENATKHRVTFDPNVFDYAKPEIVDIKECSTNEDGENPISPPLGPRPAQQSPGFVLSIIQDKPTEPGQPPILRKKNKKPEEEMKGTVYLMPFASFESTEITVQKLRMLMNPERNNISNNEKEKLTELTGVNE